MHTLHLNYISVHILSSTYLINVLKITSVAFVEEFEESLALLELKQLVNKMTQTIINE